MIAGPPQINCGVVLVDTKIRERQSDACFSANWTPCSPRQQQSLLHQRAWIRSGINGGPTLWFEATGWLYFPSGERLFWSTLMMLWWNIGHTATVSELRRISRHQKTNPENISCKYFYDFLRLRANQMIPTFTKTQLVNNNIGRDKGILKTLHGPRVN